MAKMHDSLLINGENLQHANQYDLNDHVNDK